MAAAATPPCLNGCQRTEADARLLPTYPRAHSFPQLQGRRQIRKALPAAGAGGRDGSAAFDVALELERQPPQDLLDQAAQPWLLGGSCVAIGVFRVVEAWRMGMG